MRKPLDHRTVLQYYSTRLIIFFQNETINELRITLATQNKTAMSMLNNLEEQLSQQMDSQEQQCVS